MNPVRHISKLRYDKSDTKDGGEDFYQTFEQAKENMKHSHSSGEELEPMGGMKNYDRNAIEHFYSLHSGTDFKC